MKKAVIILIIISACFSSFAEDNEGLENYLKLSNFWIQKNGEQTVRPNIGYYFNDDMGKTFTFQYSPADYYKLNQENDDSFWAFLANSGSFNISGTIPLIYDEATSDSLLSIIPTMNTVYRNISFDNYYFSLANSLGLKGYIPSKKEGFVIETEVEDYYSSDTIYRGKRFNFFTDLNYENGLTNRANFKIYKAEAQLGHDLGGKISENWLYNNSISSNFIFNYYKNINEEDNIRKNMMGRIGENFNLIYDSKDNYSITLKTFFSLSTQGEDATTFFSSKNFIFETSLNYKQKIDALTYEVFGVFGMNNSWDLDNENNYQYDATHSTELGGNLSYEINESFEIINSCAFEYYYFVNDDSLYSAEGLGTLSYEINEFLDTSFSYKIRKWISGEEPQLSQGLVYNFNAEITDMFDFEVNASWFDFKTNYVSTSLKLNI